MSRYTVYVTPRALREIKDLPGHVRQRVKRAIEGLTDNPHPADSSALELPEDIRAEAELCRLRLDKWRIVYAIHEADHAIDILAVRKRPPYDYGDLGALLAEL